VTKVQAKLQLLWINTSTTINNQNTHRHQDSLPQLAESFLFWIFFKVAYGRTDSSSFQHETTKKIMVKFGLRLSQNRAPEYPPEAYMDYDKLKEIIHDLKKKKLAR
jgi:hypothetical protein